MKNGFKRATYNDNEAIMDDRTQDAPSVEGHHAESKHSQGRRRVKHQGVIQGLVHRMNLEALSPSSESLLDVDQDHDEALNHAPILAPAAAPAPAADPQQAHLIQLYPELDAHRFPYSHDALNIGHLRSAFKQDKNPEQSLNEFVSIVNGLKAAGNYFLTRSLGPFSWGTNPSDTHIDLLEQVPHSTQSFLCVTPPETHAKDCKIVSLLCLEDIPNEGLCIRPYIILQQRSVSFSVNELRNYVAGVRFQGIEDLEKVCLILKLPNNIDPNTIYAKYSQCVVEFVSTHPLLKADHELPDLRLLSQGTLHHRLTPTLVRSIDYVIQSDAKKAQDQSIKQSSFNQESEFESVLGRYENFLKSDRQFIDSLFQIFVGMPEHPIVQAGDLQQLMSMISYDRLVAFYLHVQDLKDKLHLLSVEIERKCVPHLDPDGRYRALNEAVLAAIQNKSHYLHDLKKQREQYELKLSQLIDLLSLQIKPKSTIQNHEEVFRDGIKKILSNRYKDEVLLKWFDKTFMSSRYLLNFLIGHLDAQFFNQQKSPFAIAKNREQVCGPIHQEWQASLRALILVDERELDGSLKL